MRVFAIGIKPLDVLIERAQHADASMHHEVPTFRGTDQAGYRSLPFLEILPSAAS